MRTLFSLPLVAAMFLPLISHSAEPTPAQQLIRQDRVLIIAHRGNSSVAPENTLPAFESALRTKPDMIELDYYHSSDGVPVVFHDKDLDRTTNAVKLWGKKKIPLISRTAADLALLDAGSWFHPDFADARIPTLEQSLDLIQTGSVTLIERKGGDAATCLKLLEKKELLDQVVVQAFDWKYLADCRRLSPDLVLGALGSKPLTPARVREISASGANVLGWNHEDVTEESIAVVHKYGGKIWVYTVNDPARAKKLISWGVDGLITDRPAEMKKLVE